MWWFAQGGREQGLEPGYKTNQCEQTKLAKTTRPKTKMMTFGQWEEPRVMCTHKSKFALRHYYGQNH